MKETIIWVSAYSSVCSFKFIRSIVECIIYISD